MSTAAAKDIYCPQTAWCGEVAIMSARVNRYSSGLIVGGEVVRAVLEGDLPLRTNVLSPSETAITIQTGPIPSLEDLCAIYRGPNSLRRHAAIVYDRQRRDHGPEDGPDYARLFLAAERSEIVDAVRQRKARPLGSWLVARQKLQDVITSPRSYDIRVPRRLIYAGNTMTQALTAFFAESGIPKVGPEPEYTTREDVQAASALAESLGL